MIHPNDAEKWQQVFQIFDHGTVCEECPHHREWRERHPYGEGSAYESLRTCAVISSSREPDRCLGLPMPSVGDDKAVDDEVGDDD